jgi:hypothetical protein
MSTDNSETFYQNKYPDSTEINIPVATSFLSRVAMGGCIHVSALDPEDPTKVSTRVFWPRRDGPDGLKDFIKQYVNHNRNIYYCANEGLPSSKGPPAKADIRHLRALVIDIDPLAIVPANSDAAYRSERLRIKEKIDSIRNSDIPPTMVVDSGNGAQLIYMFEGLIALDDRLKAMALEAQRTIAAVFKGDKTTATLEHLFRVPGTRNVPSFAKQEKKGARLSWSGLWTDNGPTWSLETLHAAARKRADDTGMDADDDTHDLSDIPNCDIGALRDAVEYKLRMNPDHSKVDFTPILARVNELKASSKRFATICSLLNKLGEDRSKKDYAFCCCLYEDGEELCNIVYALAAFGAGKKHPWLYQKQWYKYLASTVMRAKKDVDDQNTRWYDDMPADGEQPKQEQKQEQPQSEPDDHQPKSKQWEWGNEALQRGFDSDSELIEGLIGRRGLSMLYGPSNSGKSLAALSLCSAITNHKPVCGHRVNAHDGCAVYVAMEGARGINTRLHAMAKKYSDRSIDRIAVIADIFDMRSENKKGRSGEECGTAKLAKIIKEISAERPVVFIVIDMLLIAANGANENSSEDMGKVFHNLVMLAEVTKSHVMVLHHTGKNTAAGARGWSGMRGRIDTELELINDKRTKNLGILGVTKQREMEIARQPLSFMINSIPIATDAYGDPVTGAVAVFDERARAANAQNAFQQLIEDAIRLIGPPCATLEQIVEELQREEPDLKATRIKTELFRMIKKGQIGYEPGKPGGKSPAIYKCWFYFDEEPEPNDPYA